MNNLRYSRQMIMPQVGAEGQERLHAKRVLVVGAGGIGSTVCLYLAGAGVATDVLDFDKVEVSNLHRQIMHDESRTGDYKATSAVDHMRKINSTVPFNALLCKLTAENAEEIITKYDLVVDATDNIDARYIINDCCVLLRKPLVSGSAVSMDGQITTIIPYFSPCYRCIYPNLNVSMGGCRSCADAGVLGPIPGLIGCLQAIEVVKLLLNSDRYINVEQVGQEDVLATGSKRHAPSTTVMDTQIKLPRRHNGKSAMQLKPLLGRQLMFDGVSGDFHTFTLPERRVDCAVCGNDPTIRSMSDSVASLLRAPETCPTVQILNTATHLSANEKSFLHSKHRIEPMKFAAALKLGPISLILDVRSPEQFSMLHMSSVDIKSFPTTHECLSVLLNERALGEHIRAVQINVPLCDLKGGRIANDRQSSQQQVMADLLEIREQLAALASKYIPSKSGGTPKITVPTFTLCRRGIDSITATQILLQNNWETNKGSSIHSEPIIAAKDNVENNEANDLVLMPSVLMNVEGGLTAWSRDVDPSMEMY